MTTLFSLATELRNNVDPADIAFIDAQLERENVDTAGLDIWASGQTTAPADWRGGRPVNDLLPLFTELVPGGPTVNRCVNIETRVDDLHNNPGKWRYLYFTLGSAQPLTLTVQANPLPPPKPASDPATARDRADPDLFLYRRGMYLGNGIDGRSGEDDREVYDMGTLDPGIYVVELHDWRHIDDERSSNYPERVCFDITLN